MFRKITRCIFISSFSLLLLLGLACEEELTQPGDLTVNLNITLPADDPDVAEFDGNTVSFYIFADETETVALYSGTTTISSGSASISITGVAEDEYYMLAVINRDGTPSTTTPLEMGDIIWGALDVDVSADLTISLTEDYLQEYHSILVGVRGIPSGNIGDVFACALMDDGANFWYVSENIIMGGVTIIYNQTAVVALGPVDDDSSSQQDSLGDDSWESYELESGNYDLLLLIDQDGSIDDYDNGDDDLNPLSLGDLYAQYDYSYNQSTPADKFVYTSATFAALQFADITLTVNYTIPDDELSFAVGDTIRLAIWDSYDDDDPLDDVEQVVTGATGSIVMDSVAEGTYLVTVTIGDSDDDTLSLSSDPFLAWGGLEIELTDDMTISVGDSMWQWVEEDVTFGLINIPSTYEGELIVFALFVDGGNYYNLQDDSNFVMAGMGYIYNGGALVTLHSNRDYIGEFELPSGNYDLIALIDTNGTPALYDSIGMDSVSMFSPYEIGDPFALINYAHDTTDEDGGFQVYTPSFSVLLGISGTITCPVWDSTGGDIWALTFYAPPFPDTMQGDNSPLTWDILSEPGDYAIPVFPGFSGYVVGVWDANDNGLDSPIEGEGGPDVGDYLGGYGGALDSLESVEALTSDITDIDFTIDIPYDDSLSN